MKQRVISAMVAFLIFIPIFIKGGMLFNLAIYALSMISLWEFLNIKSIRKELPNFITFISYIIMTLFVLVNINNQDLIYSMDYRIIVGLFLVFLVPVVLYHDRSKYSIVDAFYLIGGVFFLGTSFSLIITLRNISLEIIIFLFIITIITDTYAYLVGRWIGKTKLLESLSPKKTLEGMFGGTVAGMFVGTVFFHTVINPELPIYVVLFVTMFLSVLGQLGDLFFSAIKRYYGKKDFSNIMPGHGGILDRLDSIIFVVLGFMFFISII